jgi:DNA-binding NarL/FixJ family response regulator
MIHKPNLILVDDHLLFRQGIKNILVQQNIAHVIGEASNGIELLDLLSQEKPDLVILDIDMPRMNGIEATQQALSRFPDLKIIVFTMFGDLKYYQVMNQLGVKAFVLKSKGIHELTQAINDVIMGKTYLSNLSFRRSSNPSFETGTTAIPSQSQEE